MSLLFITLSRFVIAFLPRSKHLLISRLQSPSTMILEPKKIKSVTVSTFRPSICHEVMGRMLWSQVFECWVFSQLFHFPLSLSSRGSLVSLHFLPSEWYYLHIWGHWYFLRQSWFQLWFIQPSISQGILCISPSWITALLWWGGLPNSMRLWAIPGQATQDGQVIVESSDKTGSTGGGNGTPL